MEQQQVLVMAINSIVYLETNSAGPWHVISITKLLLPKELPHAFRHLLLRGKKGWHRFSILQSLLVSLSLEGKQC